ncbi:rhythmically expressed gene 2 protein-like [Phlebotomus argentipes]|uniref:rhythmically expressed gene 2 protein-like n=1 Tax=Phlebotomus argentipes TaxID=94469 RepID=UPI002892CAF1|nr:rhythmically expressed gene 2 protein-like [Phlebotomus argentipes]
MNKLAENLSRFRLITFDITDTLLRFRTAPAVQYAKVASEFGYPNVDQTNIAANFPRHFRQMVEKFPIFGYHHPGEIGGWKDWWQQLVIRVFEASNANIPSSDLKKIANYLVVSYGTSECWRRCSSAEHLVGDIKQLNKVVGVITNSDPRIRDVVKSLELPEFDFVLCSYDIGVQKPHRDIFQAALKLADQSIVAEECLHIGNTPHLDYLGAHEAGWSSVLITNNSDNWREFSAKIDATKVFPTLRQFHEALKNKSLNL